MAEEIETIESTHGDIRNTEQSTTRKGDVMSLMVCRMTVHAVAMMVRGVVSGTLWDIVAL